ncbi:MAG TPA: cytochrome c [Pyrinomonadaceae bacterium]|nr:cytochrome c [Pyrinomonadaceae bacterium]
MRRRVLYCLLFLAFCFLLSGCRQDMQDQPRYEVYEPSGFFKDGLSSRRPVEGTVARGYLKADKQLYTGKLDTAQAGGSNGGNSNNAAAAADQGGDESTSSRASTSANEANAQAGGESAAMAAGATQGNGGGNNNANTQSGAKAQGAQAGADDDADTFPFPVTNEVVARGRERYEIYCAMCHGYTGEGDGMIVRRGYRQPPSYHEDRLRQARAGYFFRVITEGFGAMPPYRAQVPVQDRWAIAAYIRALQLSRMNQQLAPAHAVEGQPETGGHR